MDEAHEVLAPLTTPNQRLSTQFLTFSCFIYLFFLLLSCVKKNSPKLQTFSPQKLTSNCSELEEANGSNIYLDLNRALWGPRKE